VFDFQHDTLHCACVLQAFIVVTAVFQATLI